MFRSNSTAILMIQSEPSKIKVRIISEKYSIETPILFFRQSKPTLNIQHVSNIRWQSC